MSAAVKLNLSGIRRLRELAAELNESSAQVGLFQDTAARNAKRGRIDDNPSLGKLMEEGSVLKNIPPRSFIAMPLTQHLGPTVGQVNWFEKLLKIGTKRTLAFLGVIGEETIQEAFSTGGWGAWPKLHPRTIRRKKSSAILIESAQMRKAVTSRVAP
jgi:hypothetical protein